MVYRENAYPKGRAMADICKRCNGRIEDGVSPSGDVGIFLSQIDCDNFEGLDVHEISRRMLDATPAARCRSCGNIQNYPTGDLAKPGDRDALAKGSK